MKILITGEKSYIGNSFSDYLLLNYKDYSVDKLSVRDEHWKEHSFSGYDVVFHVAGIAHVDDGKISEVDREKYYKVNTELTAEIARKAKAEGVKQFIYMSSMIVYGDASKIGGRKTISKDTYPIPTNAYGDSKLKAEDELRKLKSEDFKVAIVRSPMVYGRNCRGNFKALEKIAAVSPFFPKIFNEHSMIYIENLCEFIKLLCDNEEDGIFFPQNAEYSNTSELVRMIARAKGRKILFVPGLSTGIRLLGVFSGRARKAFGSLSYAQELSLYKSEYRKYSLEKSIEVMER